VGVFVDYEKGQVFIYNVEARTHIYSFTGSTVTEKRYPISRPCGKNGSIKYKTYDHLSCRRY
jgi:hypothetical protein